MGAVICIHKKSLNPQVDCSPFAATVTAAAAALHYYQEDPVLQPLSEKKIDKQCAKTRPTLFF